MKRNAAQYAVLSPLLDEVLPLDDRARAVWLARLPEMYESYRPALHRLLAIDSQTSRARLLNLEVRLRSSARGVGVLVLAEFDRRR
jgi:hypothetical protein